MENGDAVSDKPHLNSWSYLAAVLDLATRETRHVPLRYWSFRPPLVIPDRVSSKRLSSNEPKVLKRRILSEVCSPFISLNCRWPAMASELRGGYLRTCRASEMPVKFSPFASLHHCSGSARPLVKKQCYLYDLLSRMAIGQNTKGWCMRS